MQPRREDSIGDTFELEIIGDFSGEFVARQLCKQGDRPLRMKRRCRWTSGRRHQ